MKPQHREQQHGRELDALGEGAEDQADGDRREGALEGHVDEPEMTTPFGEGGGDRIRRDALQEQLVEAAEEGAFGEGDGVAVDDPQHADQREHREHLQEHRQHVLGAHQAAVEQGQAGDGHQNHEGSGNEQPGVVALVRHGSRRRSAGAASAGSQRGRQLPAANGGSFGLDVGGGRRDGGRSGGRRLRLVGQRRARKTDR